MQGWIIIDLKGTEFEAYLRAINLPNTEYVYLYDIELEIDANEKDRICVAGEWMKRPDYVICTLEDVLQNNRESTEVTYRVLDHLDAMGVYCMPKPDVLRKSIDKLRAGQLMVKAGVPTPHTLALTSHTTPERVVQQLGLPLIVKIPDGAKGQGVSLIHTLDELKSVMKQGLTNRADLLLAQEYIATSKGRDVRVTLADGELIFAIVRDNTHNKEFRSNVSLGGKAMVIEPTEQMLDLARRAARAVDSDFCGVDLLFTEDGFTIGEINSLPGYTEGSYNGEELNKRYLRMLMEMIARKVTANK